MSKDIKGKTGAATGSSTQREPEPSPDSMKSGSGFDDVEYVIDEYWDDKFGFQFGYLDWRSLGLGC